MDTIMKKMKGKRTLFLVMTFALFVCLNTAAAARATEPVEVAKKLQKTYENTTSIQADFYQITTVPMSSRTKKGAGTMVLKKPGRLRWDYTAPDQQVIICDGESITMYFAKANQMIYAPAKDYIQSDVTYSFFAGTGDILRDFDVLPPSFEDFPEEGMAANGVSHTNLPPENIYVIKLVPKEPHPQVDYLHVWIDTKGFFSKRIRIMDLFGSVTDLSFQNIRTNQPVKDDAFNFSPPAGTEVIENKINE